MNRVAIVASLALILLTVLPAVAAAQTTGAARPPDAAGSSDVPRIHVATAAAPRDAALPAEMRSLLGARAYPGAPTAADFGGPGTRCDILCSPCDAFEGEPICEDNYVDSYNGGCNSSPAVFDTLFPYYGTITVCGMSGNYLFNGYGYRDTDWYSIQVEQPTELHYCCAAEFPLQMFLIDGTSGCGGFTILQSANADTCVEACIDYAVGPGTYWLWVGASVFEGIPCTAEYRFTLEGFAYQNCDPTCPGGAVIENEPPCGPDYYDDWNGGCNATPEVFQRLNPSENVITVCGETGVYPITGGLCYRDTDWYEIVLDQPRQILFCVYADFPVGIFVIEGPCDNLTYEYNSAPDCTQVCLSPALDAGTYWLWVGPTTWLPVDCGRKYVMTVEGYTTAVEHTTWGTLKALYR